MSIVVLGSSGQLASHLKGIIPLAQFWGRDRIDIGDTQRLEAELLKSRPTCIINAAAYTAVDQAESEPGTAWRINAEAPAAAARAAAMLEVPLIHISTDYVFDGRSSKPYTEDAPVNPLSTYGRTKLAGDLAVSSICRRHWILRTSWVFGEFGQNFVKTMIRLARKQNTVRIVADQFGRPTYAGHLAQLVSALSGAEDIEKICRPGVYHAVGGSVTSWHGFAEKIFRKACELGCLEKAPATVRILSKEYPTSAIRPAKAVLSPSPALYDIAATQFDWLEGLEPTIRSEIADDR